MPKDGQPQTATVQVALRIRPLTQRDRAQPRFAASSENDVLKAHDNTVHVVQQHKLFTFDHVFAPQCTQSAIFDAVGDRLVRKFVEGYNVTILAYGQTSSGKTYTMGTEQQLGQFNHEQEGIVPRAASLLFDLLHNADGTRPPSPASSSASSSSGIPPFGKGSLSSRMRPPARLAPQSPRTNANPKFRYSVKVSFIEIYNEELVDLLNSAPPSERPPVTIREDTKGHIYWTGVREMTVHSADDVLSFLQQGTQNRATGATDMNEKSSRSHAILSVTLRQERWSPSATSSTSSSRPTSPKPSNGKASMRGAGGRYAMSEQPPKSSDEAGEWIITTSKFHFVDLAGSERLKRTAAEGDRRKEGININAGLLALGNVISVLGDPAKRNTHIPYRDSKLTRLLQDSLGGNATTLMIACVSPAEYNLPETMNTLQYANRARNIKNKVEKNEVEEWMTTDNIETLRTIIANLKKDMKAGKTTQDHHAHPTVPDDLASPLSGVDFDQIYQEQRMMIADLQRQVEELDGEASVTRERNRVVENELKRVRQQAHGVTPVDPTAFDFSSSDIEFQRFVEPIIEEYEKSIGSLESKISELNSQLAMARAALNHSDFGFEEQAAKLEQYEIVMDDQENQIKKLEGRIAKMIKREQSTESHIQRLEAKLENSHQNAESDEGVLNELRGRLMKFKEMDENTERYIADLERQLAEGDQARKALQEQLRELITKQQETEEELAALQQQVEANEAKQREALNEESHVSENERKRLLQQVSLLQDNVRALQEQTEQREARDKDQLARLQAKLDRVLKERAEEVAAHEEELQRLQATIQRLEASHGQDLTAQERQPTGVGSQAPRRPSLTTIGISNDPEARCNNLRAQFASQQARLTSALDKTESLLATYRSDSRKNAVLMRRVTDLDKQLRAHMDKTESDRYAFEAAWASNASEELLVQAEQEMQVQRVACSKLETKLQKTELALTGSSRPSSSISSSSSTNDRDIEELMHKMDAMMLHPEDKKRLLQMEDDEARYHPPTITTYKDH